jgi:hypothetical protein
MANEMLYSGMTDLQLAAILHQELLLLAADRAALGAHPSILELGDITGSGSAVMKVGLAGLDGYDVMAAVAEGSSSSNTGLTDASVSITVARQALQRQISDLAAIVNRSKLDPERLVADMAGAGRMRLMAMIAALSSSFTRTVGSTGVDMSVDDFFDGDILLSLTNVPAEGRLAVLHGRQIGDLRQSLRAESGALSLLPTSGDMLKAKGPGLVGMFLGYDIFQSSKCPDANSGADHAGMMIGAGAIGVARGTRAPMIGDAGQAVPAGTPIWIGFERDEAGALTKVVGNMYAGVGILQDDLGVGVVTDHA